MLGFLVGCGQVVCLPGGVAYRSTAISSLCVHLHPFLPSEYVNPSGFFLFTFFPQTGQGIISELVADALIFARTRFLLSALVNFILGFLSSFMSCSHLLYIYYTTKFRESQIKMREKQ